MKGFGWFLLGVLVAMSGQAVAQYFSYDNDGNQTIIQEAGPGQYHWQDNQGRSGWIQQSPSPYGDSRNPC